MKKIFFSAIVFLFASIMNAQVTQEWVQTYGGSIAPWNRGIALDNAGNVYVAGIYNPGPAQSMLLQKYDAAGNLLWSDIYLPAGSASARAAAVVVDGNGDVIVTGRTGTNTGFTRKYDPTGQLLWSQSTTMGPFSIVADEANSVYITSWDFLDGSPMQIIKYDAAGNLQWTASSPLVVFAGAHGRIFYKNGFLYRTGGAWITVTGKNIPVVYTRKYNASTGALVWATTYYHADKISQAGWDLTADAAGNVYVAAYVLIKAGNTQDRKSTRLNSSHSRASRMPSSA